MYTKEELAKKYLEKVIWTSIKFTKEQYIIAIISEKTIYEKLNVAKQTISTLNKKLYPNKPNSVKPINYIVNFYGYKHCSNCNNCLLKNLFSHNKARSDNLNSWCKICQSNYQQNNLHIWKEDSARRRAIIYNTEIAKERNDIKKFYKNCSAGYQVDHIIPLSKNGTHTLDNLQYLTKFENLSKHNKIL